MNKFIEKRFLYLKYLNIYLNNNDRNIHLFRTFVDNWYAYYKGGPMLNKNLNPKWFNNPSPIKEKEALISMHFISKNAMNVINKKSKSRLVKDHSIPLKIMQEIFFDKIKGKIDIYNIEKFLIEFYRLGVITKDEDNKLTVNGLRSAMPINWDKSCPFSRYEFVNIEEYCKVNS